MIEPGAEAAAGTADRGTASRATWPIIVGGCHRSGTSLVRRLLDAHSRIYCGPEVKFFRDYFNDYILHDPIRHVRFMSSVRAMLPEDEVMDILGGAFVALHERAAALAGKARWADKNPENVLYSAQWDHLLGSRWVLVHVVRNPLDTLASIKETNWSKSIPTGLDERIDLYHRYTGSGLEFGAAHPERYHRVTYEDLVAEPTRALTALMDALDEEPEPAQFRFNDVPHQAGLEDPKIGTTSEIHRQSVGRWRELLTAEEAARIAERCAPLWRQVDPMGRHGACLVP
jgi:hypothetical protein